MKFENDSDTVRITRRINVIDGPVLSMQFSALDRKFRAERVKVDYTLKEDRWTSGWSVDVSGTVLKKDGTDSKNDHTAHIYTSEIRTDPERWDWLVDLVEAARPLGVPLLPGVGE